MLKTKGQVSIQCAADYFLNLSNIRFVLWILRPTVKKQIKSPRRVIEDWENQQILTLEKLKPIVIFAWKSLKWFINNQNYCWFSVTDSSTATRKPLLIVLMGRSWWGVTNIDRFLPDGSMNVHNRFPLWKYVRHRQTDGGCRRYERERERETARERRERESWWVVVAVT